MGVTSKHVRLIIADSNTKVKCNNANKEIVMARHDTRDTGVTVLHFARTLYLTLILTLALSLYQVLYREQRSGTGEGTEGEVSGYSVSALEQFVMPLRPVKFAFNFTYTRRNCATRV